jgi:hypothetical protein
MQTLNEYLASALLRKSQKRFSSLHADWLAQKREQEMNSGTIQNDNHKGSAADGFNARPDVVNAGSKTPEGVTAQSNGTSTSPVTSGATASSQVSPLVVKNVGARPLVGSHADSKVENEGADFSTDKLRNQAGPRGETTQTPNAGA